MINVEEKNADSDSPLDRLVIPQFVKPVMKDDVIGIIRSYLSGTPRNLVAEDFCISTKKVSAIINNLQDMPNGWVAEAEEFEF